MINLVRNRFYIFCLALRLVSGSCTCLKIKRSWVWVPLDTWLFPFAKSQHCVPKSATFRELQHYFRFEIAQLGSQRRNMLNIYKTRKKTCVVVLNGIRHFTDCKSYRTSSSFDAATKEANFFATSKILTFRRWKKKLFGILWSSTSPSGPLKPVSSD